MHVKSASLKYMNIKLIVMDYLANASKEGLSAYPIPPVNADNCSTDKEGKVLQTENTSAKKPENPSKEERVVSQSDQNEIHESIGNEDEDTDYYGFANEIQEEKNK